jgi:DNA-binding PadR family transcriptional regulator
MTALRKTTASEDGLAGPALNIILALGTDALHGYAIMQTIAERSQGTIRILPGTLYSTMKKLLADGLVEECEPPRGAESDDQRRRYYRVTKDGRTAARAETERLALLVKLGRAFS